MHYYLTLVHNIYNSSKFLHLFGRWSIHKIFLIETHNLCSTPCTNFLSWGQFHFTLQIKNQTPFFFFFFKFSIRNELKQYCISGTIIQKWNEKLRRRNTKATKAWWWLHAQLPSEFSLALNEQDVQAETLMLYKAATWGLYLQTPNSSSVRQISRLIKQLTAIWIWDRAE